MPVNVDIPHPYLSEEPFILYPNPVRDKITIISPDVFENSVITVINITGKTETKDVLRSIAQTLDISMLQNGRYALIMTKGSEALSKNLLNN